MTGDKSRTGGLSKRGTIDQRVFLRAGWMDGRNFSSHIYFCDHGSWIFFFRSLLRGKETNVGNDVCLFFSPPLLSGIPMKIVDL